MYENLILLEPDIYLGQFSVIPIYGYKFFFPIFLVGFWGLPTVKVLNRASVGISLLSFFLFFIWALIPTLNTGTVISWIKLLPSILLYVGAMSFFSKNNEAFKIFAICLIVYVLFAFVQYWIIVFFKFYELPSKGSLSGPFGLLGNTFSRINLTDTPIFRLTGFWKEPSNAAGSAFAAFYLSKYLYKSEERKIWIYCSWICLISGILTLSNAGYLALGCSMFVGFIFSLRSLTSRKVFKALALACLIPVFIWFALFGREYFAEKGSDNYYFLAFVGVRSLSNINSADYDPSDGRLDLMKYSMTETAKNFIGKGVQVTGANGLTAPAGAPLFWLLLTGLPGILLLLLRDFPIYFSLWPKLKRNADFIYIIQAFIVVLVQQASYGSWMDANFIIFLAVLAIGIPKSINLKYKQELCVE